MSTRLRDAHRTTELAPEFTAAPELLDAISPAEEPGGLMLGYTTGGEALRLTAVRPEPTRMILVGGLYLAHQLALRAVAIGARVVVATGRPASWHVVQQAAGTGSEGGPGGPGGGTAPHVQLRRLSAVELPRPSESSPLLVVHDGGPTPQDLFPPRSPWQTTLYVLPYLHPQAHTTANSAELIIMQRLPPAQSALAGRLWYLPARLTDQLNPLADDQVIMMGRNIWRHVRLVTTPGEEEILGPVRRGD